MKEVSFESPINGALLASPLSHPGVNAWARENPTMKLGDHQTTPFVIQPQPRCDITFFRSCLIPLNIERRRT
jgi:hypothetical protein